MKKITLGLCFAFLVSMVSNVNAQVLNQNANWPNANWTLTGTYSVEAGALEADPTVDANFAFDDDDAGNGSDDSIAAESPVIDLTAASNAGETWISISTTYAYYKLSPEEFLRFQYYDADSMTWENWEPESLPGTLTDIFDDFCAGTPVAYDTQILNIMGFTANQLSNFQYRILFDDDPNGPAYEYGFCMQAPTIVSATPPSCPDPSNLAGTVVSTTEATLSWTETGSATLWNVELLDVTAGDTQTMTATDVGVSNPLSVMGLTPGNDYEYYVQSDCGGDGTSNWVGPFAWTQPLPGNVCEAAIVVGALPYNTTDDTSNYADDYDGVPGTDCGTGNNYLNGDDVVYEYTAIADGSINISLTTIGSTYTGVFAYNDCADIGVMCAVEGASNLNGTDDLEFDLTVTNGETYYIVISTWATPQDTTYTLDITENTCTDATVTYTVVDDCANSGGFLIVVDITDLGSATDITISDDQGGSQQVTAIGMYNVGPFANATDVIVTVADDNDVSCVQMSGTLTQAVCPPTNDLCEDATTIACGETLTAQTTIGATGGSATSCNGTIGDDVWFQFTGNDNDVTITVDASVQEAQIGVFESTDGTCAGFTLGTCIASVDDFGGNPTSVTFAANAGSEYFIQVGNWINGDPGLVFEISATCTPFPTDELDFYNLQFPATGAINGGDEYLVFAQCYEAGLTDTTAGQAPGVEAWIGYSDADTDPSGAEWTWIPADFNLEVGNNDEYFIDLGAQVPGTGTFYYASRWALNGSFFTYGGIQADGSFGGQWGDNNNISGVLTVSPPVNDACAGAIVLNDGDSVSGSTNSANNVEGLTACQGGGGSATTGCAGGTGTNNFGEGVWYVFTAGPDIAISVTTDNSPIPFDTEIQVFSGDCNNLVCVGGDDDGGDNAALSTFCWESSATTGNTVDYFIYVDGHATNSGEFVLDINTESTLSTIDFENQNSLKYFPNPVENTLTLSATQNIQSVSVLNILGQEVLRSVPNALENVLDMNGLKSGSYFVQVTINNVTETVRIIKK